MHEAAFRAVGLESTYFAINIPRGEVSAALRHLTDIGYKGVNVTVPHKEEAMRFVESFVSDYPNLGVVNTIELGTRRGFNTDTTGFARTLNELGIKPGSRCLVLGAGGAAKAILAVLRAKGAKISLWNRTEEKARILAQEYALIGVVREPRVGGYDLIINATTSGKAGSALPVDWAGLKAGAVAYDLFYSPHSTPFLEVARRYGALAMDGVKLLVYQGAEAWPCWGISSAPPVELMEKTVREALAAQP
jgi:shikimate dehydrogenase